ncbi:hypothetical protein BH11BAC4_BH11BAC4_04910 [soil metagenome]
MGKYLNRRPQKNIIHIKTLYRRPDGMKIEEISILNLNIYNHDFIK